MKRLSVLLPLLSLLAIGAPCAVAAEDGRNWFTITGDPLDPQVNTIQVDAVPVAIKNNIRLLNLRLSRAKLRTSGDGITFRSFESLTEFDCERRTARYTRTQFYADPLWKSPTRVMDYPSNDVRPMAFREIEPNPNERIIRAACSFENTSSGAGSPKRQ